MSWSVKESFKKYKVPAKSLEDFLEKYVKPKAIERTNGGKIALKEYLEREGYVMVAANASVTGEVVAYFPEEVQK